MPSGKAERIIKRPPVVGGFFYFEGAKIGVLLKDVKKWRFYSK